MNRNELQNAIAKSLRDFGYPDVTAAMVSDVWDAYASGVQSDDLPHGVVGMFVERQLDEIAEARPDILKRQ